MPVRLSSRKKQNKCNARRRKNGMSKVKPPKLSELSEQEKEASFPKTEEFVVEVYYPVSVSSAPSSPLPQKLTAPRQRQETAGVGTPMLATCEQVSFMCSVVVVKLLMKLARLYFMCVCLLWFQAILFERLKIGFFPLKIALHDAFMTAVRNLEPGYWSCVLLLIWYSVSILLK